MDVYLFILFFIVIAEAIIAEYYHSQSKEYKRQLRRVIKNTGIVKHCYKCLDCDRK